MPQNALGIFPSEPSPLGEPFRLPAARASLRVRTRPLIRHESPGDLRPVSPARPARAPVAPLRALWEQEKGNASSPRPSCQIVPSSARVAPPADLERPTGTFGHCRHTAAPPASKPCSLRESVHAADRASCRGLCARACAPTHGDRPGRCSPGIQPLQSLLHHDLGFGRLRVSPGANRTTLGRPRPTPVAESGASILRPSTSGTSGGTRVAARIPHRRTLRASAPAFAGAPASPALCQRRLSVNRCVAGGASEVLKTWWWVDLRETDQLSWGSLPSRPFLPVWGARGAWLIGLESNASNPLAETR
jgi:hypothetical protein